MGRRFTLRITIWPLKVFAFDVRGWFVADRRSAIVRDIQIEQTVAIDIGEGQRHGRCGFDSAFAFW